MSDVVTVTDARGRKITLRELDPSDMLDLIEAMPVCESQGMWLRYAQVMHSVTQIDDLPVIPPRSRSDVKAIARMLGNDGFEAVSKHIFGDGIATDQDEAAKIKN